MQELLTNGELAELFRSNPRLMAALFAVVITIGILQRMLGPSDDWVESKRKRALLTLEELITMVGTFSVRELHPYEYACRIHVDEADLDDGEEPADVVERALYQEGVHRNLLASKKFRRDGAVRTWTDSSWAKREYFFAKRQLHIHLVPVEGASAIDVYVHEEPSPISQPIRHVAVDAMEYEEAIAQTHRLLDRTDLTYEVRDAPSA